MSFERPNLRAPHVSICIPTHRPTFLIEALKAALEQRHDDFEIVVSDDSENGSGESIARAVGDDRIRYFRNERNAGYPANLTLALNRARGDLIGLLQDDDRWLPDFLLQAVAPFDADPAVGLVFTKYYFDRNGSTYLPPFPSVSGGKYQSFLSPLLRYKLLNLSAVLMRREVWEVLRPFPNIYQADYALFIRAADAGYGFYYVEQPLMVYRLHSGQMTTNEMGYRGDEPKLWDMFRFDDPDCERMRRVRLASALLSLAASHIKRRHFEDARQLGGRARELAPSRLSLRERLIMAIALHPTLARASARAWPAVRLFATPFRADRWPTLEAR